MFQPCVFDDVDQRHTLGESQGFGEANREQLCHLLTPLEGRSTVFAHARDVWGGIPYMSLNHLCLRRASIARLAISPE